MRDLDLHGAGGGAAAAISPADDFLADLCARELGDVGRRIEAKLCSANARLGHEMREWFEPIYRYELIHLEEPADAGLELTAFDGQGQALLRRHYDLGANVS